MMTPVGGTGYLLGRLSLLLQFNLPMVCPYLVQREPEFVITHSIQTIHFSVSSCCTMQALFSRAASHHCLIFDGISFSADGSGYSDLAEPPRFHKVLQGQEIMGLKTPYDGNVVMKSQTYEARNHRSSEIRRCIADASSCMLAGSGNAFRIPAGNSDFPYKGFGESVRFHKVLQGQEIVSLIPAYQGAPDDARIENGGLRVFSQSPNAGSRWPASFQEFNNPGNSPTSTSAQVSSPSSVLMFQQASSQLPCPNLVYGINNHGKGERSNLSGLLDAGKPATLPCPPCYMGCDCIKEHYGVERVLTSDDTNRGILPSSRKSCRLFGFPLTEVNPVANGADVTPIETSSLRNFGTSFSPLKPQTPAKLDGSSCTKVYKRGSVVGRAIDLSKLGGYDDLICELEQLFDMKGLLNDPQKGWQVVYTAAADDMLRVGDDPWQLSVAFNIQQPICYITSLNLSVH